tara:strand:+ start:28 stop:300 length:273 start_codon:yes stop_codon:yes gene_type:complete
MRELLTLQFGHYANHVGAHYWNFQEESYIESTRAQQNDSQRRQQGASTSSADPTKDEEGENVDMIDPALQFRLWENGKGSLNNEILVLLI